MKAIAGSILVGFSLLSQVVSELIQISQVARVSVGTQVIIWIMLILGVALVIWGLLETAKKPSS